MNRRKTVRPVKDGAGNDRRVIGMFKNGAHYNGIGPYLKDRFGTRIAKVSIDGGFTCPNRDGSAGLGGCIFCSETGSGDFAGKRILGKKTGPKTGGIAVSIPSMRKNALREVPSVTAQIDAQIGILRKKWPDFRCVAYFQNFTNTYAPVALLKERFEEALRHPLCTGLAVATRPDCLGPDVEDYLADLHDRTFLWVELGLQTSDEISAQRIRRGYPFSVYKEAVNRLTARGIRVITHLIAGLPGEDRENFLHSVRRTVSDDIFGVKLQLLHIMKNTELGRLWQVQQAASSPDGSVLGTQRGQGKAFPGAGLPENTLCEPASFPRIRPLGKEEYISWIADALEIIPPQITIHRLTGDAPKDTLLAPLWSRDKKAVLNGINMELKKRGTCQGSRI